MDTQIETNARSPVMAAIDTHSDENQAEFRDRRIIAIIPAFNEARFIGSVVLLTRQLVSQVIVVDDGSSDQTAAIAEQAGAQVILHTENVGKSAALTSGFHLAQSLQPDVVVMLDADGQHLPGELFQVVRPVLDGEADIVIGSRYLVRMSDVPRHRVWGHRLFNLLTNLTSGVTVSDSQSGYRAFSPAALQVVNFQSRGFSVESEMQFIARENHLKLVEVPITVQYTDKPKRPVMSHGAAVLNGVMKMIGQYRPLLFFGLPGAILLIIGLFWGLLVVNIYDKSQELAVGYAMISVLFTLIGMLGLSTGIILHSIRGLLVEMLKGK